MSKWVDNILKITVEESLKDNLLKELEGPSDWMVPHQPLYLAEKKLTNHQQMEFKKFLNKGTQYLKDLIYQKERKYTTTPWIPITEEDIDTFIRQELKISCRNPFRHKILVPFSFPKLLPWVGENEFKTFFPGYENKDGLWEKDPKEIQKYNTGRLGYNALYESKLNGVRLPYACDIRIKNITTLNGQSTITIVFITSWNPVKDVDIILSDVLLKYKAIISVTSILED